MLYRARYNRLAFVKVNNEEEEIKMLEMIKEELDANLKGYLSGFNVLNDCINKMPRKLKDMLFAYVMLDCAHEDYVANVVKYISPEKEFIVGCLANDYPSALLDMLRLHLEQVYWNGMQIKYKELRDEWESYRPHDVSNNYLEAIKKQDEERDNAK